MLSFADWREMLLLGKLWSIVTVPCKGLSSSSVATVCSIKSRPFVAGGPLSPHRMKMKMKVKILLMIPNWNLTL
jgi:hypothetical protein